MKVWIDGYEANVLQRLGSSQVAFELIRTLELLDRKNEYTILLPSAPAGELPKEREGWNYKILKPKRLWTNIALPAALFLNRQKPDIFLSPTHYIPRFCPRDVKRICTIFDLSFLHFPEMFKKQDLWQLKNWTKFSVENTDYIVTISNFSKKDIIGQYGVRKEKIAVAYPGYDKDRFKIQSDKLKVGKIKKKYRTGDRYIIFIGTIQPRKNLIRLMEALARIEDIQLLIVGKTTGEGRQGWMFEDILQAPKKLGINSRVIFTGFVPTDDLPYLLSGATAFILPSLWEGFGIPVVEAMGVGCPVIVSNVSSLPEVVGKAGFLVDPYSINQIEQAIRTITSDKKLRQKYSNTAIEQAKKFSWNKMARTVLKLYN